MKLKRTLTLASALALTWMLSACGDESKPSTNPSLAQAAGEQVGSDTPIAYAKRSSAVMANPTNGAPSAPGGDLIIRERSSASAAEHNITARFTQGQGDATSPAVSYDGKKLLFAMRCPTSNTAMITVADAEVKACTGHWNIWEYDMSTGGLKGGSFRRLTSSTTDDDVDPTYLPGGRGVVFTSNRQTKSRLNQALGQSYYALDEYERERVFNLHTMDADGGAITQISFNQSHDRSPVVRQNGEIMFSRWDHVGGRNHFKIFRVKPDGTDLFVLYGAHSEGNSFLHPREMDPSGRYKGFVSSDLMPLSGTREGGALVFVDVTNYSEQNTPVSPALPPEGGQSQPTAQALNHERGLSMYGRVTTPYPLWDGTDRVLLSYSPCQVRRQGQVVSCATLTDAEKARLGDRERMVDEVESDEIQDNVPPAYAVYMFDPAKKTWLIVAAPPAGYMYTHPVTLQSRDEPSTSDPIIVDQDLADQNMGTIEVRSVYDTDGLGRMGDPVLLPVDLPPGCTTSIPKIRPTDALDTRAFVADLVRMKDPADAAYGCTPARFIRVTRAVAPPAGMMGAREAIGETDFEMQQILGYAPIEPDGSFKLKIPADTPIAVAVIDASGRAYQTHTNWIQVRPGERRTCDGCHSPRRGGAINSGAVVNAVPAGLKTSLVVGSQTLPAIHQSGETLAGTRTRVDPSALQMSAHMIYTDIWADTTQTGVTARPAINLSYSGLATTVPTDGVINYPEHIQPLWTRSRGTNGAQTCTNCHNDPAKLDLRGTVSGTGRITSYEELMVGDPVIDTTTGLPRTTIRQGVPMIERGPALVDTSASEGDALGLARKSRLSEILWGQTLFAGSGARSAHPNPPGTAPDHATLLNASEKRLLAEWMDLGGKYYNNPFNGSSGVRVVNGLSESTFTSQVFPILRSTCAASCHQAVGSSASATPVGSSFRNNRFVLTGDAEGDHNVTLSMISDACTAGANALLAKPSTVPHPSGSTRLTPILPTGSAAYTTIANWIQSGCVSP
jgi:Hydrazine synthase alpha subunit middle domain